MLDCLIVGGGIIGLAIGDELAKSGRRVTVLAHNSPDPQPFGSDNGGVDRRRSASAASAGILPPPVTRAQHDPLEQFRSLSDRLFPDWAQQLQADTHVDVDYEKCGGLYLARSSGEAVALQVAVDDWQHDGVEVEEVQIDSLRQMEKHVDFSNVQRAYRLPAEQRVRPTSLLQALAERATKNGLEIRHTKQEVRLELQNERVSAVADDMQLHADEVIVAAGPWSTKLLQPLGFDIGVEPRRGQIAMWQVQPNLIRHVINEGPRYVLCRADGELISGSTVEESEFDCNTTDEGIQTLVKFAEQLVPQLRGTAPDSQWAGLRPHSRDGVPSVGRVAAIDNLTIATGHFRSGIHLAPATATLVRQVISGETPELDLTPFDARRN